MQDVQARLIEEISKYSKDPLGHADFVYPWGVEGTPLEGHSGPRDWQKDVLTDIRDHLQNPDTRFQPLMISVASGHGIGKSAEIGMITKWAMDTCPNTRIVCTANTDGQLKSKTAPEIKKWHKMALTKDWFELTATAIYSKDPKCKDSWRCDFTAWSKENSEAFAGLHNEGSRIVVVFDEASAIDDVIWEVTEGALTDDNTEIIWIAFGNPTRNVGRFRECFRKHSKAWKTRHIDSRDVEGTNKELFKQWSKLYGEDSDFMRIRVKGQFPRQSTYQLYSQEEIDGAFGKHLREEQYNFAPGIISCDPAWTGDDDLVIGYRQGLMYRVLKTMPKNDNDVQIANIIARYEDELNAEYVWIDGGYGTGIYSAGKTMGRHWQIVFFGEKSVRKDCVNKRAEMYVKVKEWLQSGGSIESNDDLYEEMVAVETKPHLEGKYQLPSKEKSKEILGRSPNQMDALAITFAFEVHPKLQRAKPKKYDPLENLEH